LHIALGILLELETLLVCFRLYFTHSLWFILMSHICY